MPPATRLITAALLIALPTSAFSAPGNAARGRRAFTAQCAACHYTKADNRLEGPGLLGVVGRKAGTFEGFAFSEAMKKSGVTWDAATLDKYLAAPTEFVPGTTMLQPVTAASARADLIAFLNTLTPGEPSAP